MAGPFYYHIHEWGLHGQVPPLTRSISNGVNYSASRQMALRAHLSRVGSQRFNKREDREIYCIQKKVEKCLKAVRSRWKIRQDWWCCQHSYAWGFRSSPESEGTIQGPSSPVLRQGSRVSGSDGQGFIHCPPGPRKRVPISLAPWLGITASRDPI